MKYFSLAVATLIVQAGCLCYGSVPVSDLDGNCKVDSADLALMALQWLNTGERIADLDNNERVNLADFAIFAGDFGQKRSPLIITEFMADNDDTFSTVIDSVTVYPDWIEIYNRSSETVELDGWFLTDNDDLMTQWAFPSHLSIASKSYLVVFASGKTQQENPGNYPFFDGTYYHTNFKLSNNGEYLALAGPVDELSEFSPDYPSQSEDISYGLLPEDDDMKVFFTNATPETENTPGYVPSPIFSISGGLYDANFILDLVSNSPTAQVYYAANGQDPNPSYTLYSAPILMSDSRVIKAYAVDSGVGVSQTAAEYYIRIDASVSSADSDLPIVVLDSMHAGPNQDNYVTVSTAVIDTDSVSGRSAIGDDPQYLGRAGIKIRGATSSGWPKKQYSFEIRDESDTDKAVKLLGMPEESDWILHAPYSDKTLMRNYLTYALANEMGQYAVRCRYVELYLNTNNDQVDSSDYAGVYILMERIKRDSARVDIDELEPYHNSEPEITGGYIFCRDRPEADEFVLQTNRGFNEIILREPDSYDVTEQQKTWIQQHFNDVEEVLFSSNYTDPETGYAAYVDPDSFIDTHLLVQACKNIDGIRLSNFFYKDRGGRITMGPPWDYNLAYGNANYLDGYITSGWYGVSNDSYLWFGRMFTDDNYRLRYADRWFQLREHIFNTDKLAAQVDQIAALLDEAQQRNFTRWPVLGTYLWPNPDGFQIRTTYQSEIDWMKAWHAARFAWMDSQVAVEYAPAPPSFNQDGGYVSDGFEVDMTSGNGAVYFTTNGQDPRLHGGAINPQAMIFGEDIFHGVSILTAGSSWKYLDNGSDQGTAWRNIGFDDSSWASGNAQLGYGDGDEATVINYGPDSSDKYATTYFRKTFEIDDVSEIIDFTVRIKRDDGAIVYINSTPAQTNEVGRTNMPGGSVDYETHASDVCGGDDENIYFEFSGLSTSLLQNGENTIAVEVHQISGGSSDVSFDLEVVATMFAEGHDLVLDESTQVMARAKNGSTWTALNEATFAVGAVADSLRVTEIMYHPADPNMEYIELRNIGAEAINLNRVQFTKGIDYTFPSWPLPVDGYVLVVRNETVFNGAYSGLSAMVAGQFEGALDNGGEKIKLIDAAGTTIQSFDYNDWYDITDGFGFSLVINDDDSADPNQWDQKSGWHPSANKQGDPGDDQSHTIPALGSIIVNEVLAHSDQQPDDWIELYNATADPIDIGGWYISDSDADETYRKKYQIASGTTINDHSYLVLYENQHFRNAADPGSNITFGLSENGETIYLQSASGGELTGYIDQQQFGPSQRDISMGRHEKSTGTFNFVAMSSLTPAGQNDEPKVGPIIMTEFMYHPQGVEDAEYVVLKNISASDVTLFHPVEDIPWRFVDDADDPGINFAFPADTPVTMAPNEKILLVKNRTAYEMEYGALPAGMQYFQWLTGSLSNDSEKPELQMPGDVDNYGNRYWVRKERVSYDDKAPWPTEADGQGDALRRLVEDDYGNDPANWDHVAPNP